MSDYKKELEKLLVLLTKDAESGRKVTPLPATPNPPAPRAPPTVPRRVRPERLDVVIGLDFGTRFTKVAYRIVGIEQTHVIIPDQARPDSALFKSTLYVDRQNLMVHRFRPAGQITEELPYLKLLLKDLEQPSVAVPIMLQKMLDQDSIKALSAFFLAGVLRTAILTILAQEKRRVAGKDLFYALNVSLPADHCDDSARERFKEVASVALQWSMDDLGVVQDTSFATLKSAYAQEASEAASKAEVAVFPEIIAALYQFITRSDTPAGVHGFLDIGGGTIDGCVFRLLRGRGGTTQVNVLSAKVATLGTIIVAKKALSVLYADLERRVEKELVTRSDIQIAVPLPLKRASEDLGNFAGDLLMTARNKSAGQVLVQDPSAAFDTSHLRRELKTPFTFMVGGGGARSGWYTKTFAAVHSERNLASSNIMPFDCRVVSPPNDFSPPTPIAFERFIISHGLTTDAPNLESLITKLPSQLLPGTALPTRAFEGPGGISYSDSKDANT
jgi:hypothetical protein